MLDILVVVLQLAQLWTKNYG